ncbi:MAG: hypothetical protein QME52_05410 [Bacteroidota bacterium]|nr:hypothetical protein [Bacteroidota bacterium]
MILFIYCCSSKKTSDTVHLIIGTIQVIGNEPFTKLAIETEDGTVYFLKAEDDIEERLLKYQGQFVKILYKEIEELAEGKSILVEHAELIKERNPK